MAEYAAPGPLVKNDREGYTVKEWGDYLVEIMPMIYNARIVLTPKNSLDFYDHGWCFNEFLAAYMAALVWEPGTEDEPMGWHKRATPGLRRAPDRPADQTYRCEHGKWPQFEVCEYCSNSRKDPVR